MNTKRFIAILLILVLALTLAACNTTTGTGTQEETTSASGPPSDDMSAPVRIGDIIEFGDYNWRVLEVIDGKVLLLSDQIIEPNIYHLELKDITWEKSFLRQSINSRILEEFTKEEQEQIIETKISNPDNLWYGTKGGADTKDKLFLLSLAEVDRYFGDSGDYLNERRKKYTDGSYQENDAGSVFSNAYDSDRVAILGYGDSWWWLRSPGAAGATAAVVNIGGEVNVRGRDVDNMHPDMGGVRIALWLNMGS